MSIWSFQYCDVLRGEYIYKRSLSDETIALDKYEGLMFIRLFSGIMINY